MSVCPGRQPAHVVKDAETLVIGSPPGATRLLPEGAASLFDKASRVIPSSTPQPLPRVSASLASAYLTNVASSNVRGIVRMTEIGAGLPLEAISARWWGFGRAIGGTDGAPIGGYSSIIDRLAGDITSGSDGKEGAKKPDIRLSEEVTAIAHDDKNGLVQVTTKSGTVYTAKNCICTIPLGVLKVSPPSFTPPLDGNFLAAVKRTSVGTLEKLILSYPEAWWPSPEKYGSYVILPNTPEMSSAFRAPTSLPQLFAQTTLNVANMARAAPSSHNTLLVYLGASAGQFIADYPADQVAATLHAYLALKLAPLERAKKLKSPSQVTITSWGKDPFSRGATSSPIALPPKHSGDEGDRDEPPSPLDFITLSRPTWSGRLGFGGEHTDLDGRGSVVGALVSGRREGERVAGVLKRELEVGAVKE